MKKLEDTHVMAMKQLNELGGSNLKLHLYSN